MCCIYAFLTQNQRQLYIQRRGAEIALTSLAQDFGKDLHNKLPNLWETLTKPLLISGEGKNLKKKYGLKSQSTSFQACWD